METGGTAHTPRCHPHHGDCSVQPCAEWTLPSAHVERHHPHHEDHSAIVSRESPELPSLPDTGDAATATLGSHCCRRGHQECGSPTTMAWLSRRRRWRMPSTPWSRQPSATRGGPSRPPAHALPSERTTRSSYHVPQRCLALSVATGTSSRPRSERREGGGAPPPSLTRIRVVPVAASSA
jgi:hypothetical protein